ncbi:MAG: ABC transporter substrate-binding protein [Sphingomonadales bacterium]|nr:ABC transporter substrate-binding protein [Sphingomonadales bacterium]
MAQRAQNDRRAQGSLGGILFSSMALLGVAAVALWWAMQYLQPPPQRTLVISTGAQTGAYHSFAQSYQRALNRSGIRTELKPSAGSVENLNRLRDGKSGVLAALMQGGIADEKTAPGILSLGGIFLEPVWIFHRSGETIVRLAQLKGRRIAIGPEGSGTRALVLALLSAAQLHGGNTELLPLTGAAARDALLAGTADVMFGVAAAETPLIQAMLRDPRLGIMSMTQADALTRLFPYLTKVVLPQGVVDLENNIPASDVALMAAVASLVVRNDLHPALVSQLAQAAAEAHGGANWFQRAGQFPMASDSAFPMSPDAVRFYRSGPPFLQRYLPFWIANLVERAAVLLVPLFTIAFPILRGGPALYRWNIHRRLRNWYARLQRLEAGMFKMPVSSETLDARRKELDEIEASVGTVRVPKAYAQQLYHLREHVEFVRAKLASRRGEA